MGLWKGKGARPSPAIIVAVMALVAALAGTAIAGPTASTSVSKKKTRQISKKITNNKINKFDNSLTIGSEKVGPINERTSTTTINTASSGQTTASCQGGEKLIAGGGKFTNAPLNQFAFLQGSHRTDSSWTASAAVAIGPPQELTAYAYCLESSSNNG